MYRRPPPSSEEFRGGTLNLCYSASRVLADTFAKRCYVGVFACQKPSCLFPGHTVLDRDCFDNRALALLRYPGFGLTCSQLKRTHRANGRALSFLDQINITGWCRSLLPAQLLGLKVGLIFFDHPNDLFITMSAFQSPFFARRTTNTSVA